jgi:hypothetical protein
LLFGAYIFFCFIADHQKEKREQKAMEVRFTGGVDSEGYDRNGKNDEGFTREEVNIQENKQLNRILETGTPSMFPITAANPDTSLLHAAQLARSDPIVDTLADDFDAAMDFKIEDGSEDGVHAASENARHAEITAEEITAEEVRLARLRFYDSK